MKRLSKDQEFEILKLVFDKLLWIGVAILGYGFYIMMRAQDSVWYGLSVLLAGSVLLIIFMYMLIVEARK